MKKLTLLLALVMLFTLAACGVSGSINSSTSVSVSKTDENGTITSKVANETGVSVDTDGLHVTNETTTEETTENAREAGRALWLETFPCAAYGETENECFYFLWDNSDDIRTAVMLITEKTGDVIVSYVAGGVRFDGQNSFVIDDESGEEEIPFNVYEPVSEGAAFMLLFQNGEEVEMYANEPELIIDLMLDYIF